MAVSSIIQKLCQLMASSTLSKQSEFSNGQHSVSTITRPSPNAVTVLFDINFNKSATNYIKVYLATLSTCNN